MKSGRQQGLLGFLGGDEWLSGKLCIISVRDGAALGRGYVKLASAMQSILTRSLLPKHAR
jgi:hypothetical protein